jgi:DNA-binding FrmR family transcriptional regulator
MPYQTEETRNDLLARLRRIEGQVRGIHRMVEQDTYCIDILTQVSAAVSALDKVGLKVVANHVQTCVREAVSAPEPEAGRRHVEELVDALERFLKA